MLVEEANEFLGLVDVAFLLQFEHLGSVGVEFGKAEFKLVVGGKKLLVERGFVHAINHRLAHRELSFRDHDAEAVHKGLHEEIRSFDGFHLADAHYFGAIFLFHIFTCSEEAFFCFVFHSFSFLHTKNN